MRFFFPVLLCLYGVISGSQQTWPKKEDDFPGRPAKEESSFQEMPRLTKVNSVPASNYIRDVKKPSKLKQLLCWIRKK